jgi:hypothetical protein
MCAKASISRMAARLPMNDPVVEIWCATRSIESRATCGKATRTSRPFFFRIMRRVSQSIPPWAVQSSRSKRVFNLPHSRSIRRHDEVTGAEGASLVLFPGRGGDGRDLAAQGAGELDGEVAQASHTDDADLWRGARGVRPKRGIHGDTSAHQDRGHFGGHGGRQRASESAVHRHRGGETAAGGLRTASNDVLAEVLAPFQAPLALHARTALPANADPIPFLQFGYGVPYRRHVADDLVTGHEGEGEDTEAIVDGVDVRVTEATAGDRDTDVVVPKFWRLDGDWLKRLPCRPRCEAQDG